MVSLYFGLPGCGKTTILTMLAVNACHSKRYAHVYSNVYLDFSGKSWGSKYRYIENNYIGKYDLSDSLILVDEASLFVDSRDWSKLSKDTLQYFLLHRHYNSDIALFTQQWDGVDRKIRVITDRVYYVYKGFFTRSFLSKYWRVPYGIIIPSKDDNNEKLGEIIQGYCKPNLLVRIFAKKCFRPFYYKYFDSWVAPKLPPLPPKEDARQSVTACVLSE